jgi:4-hydroxy-tetrahydrodipicolinate reductase
MRKVRIVLCGVGAVGALIAKFLLQKEGVEIVGAVDTDENKVNKDLGEVLNLQTRLGITVSNDADLVLGETKPDIAVQATSSFLRDTYPQIVTIVKNGVNVVSTCEELSYPYSVDQRLSEELDSLAKKHDVTVLGTGVNPGFLMDTLVITLTAPCQRIDKIEATRVMNAATRRLPFQKKIGAGLTIQEFKRKIQSRAITGHVGLEQSIRMIAEALAWKLERVVVEPVEAVVAEKNTASESIEVRAGNAAGLKQRARGIMNGKDVIVLDFQAYLGAEEEFDSVEIKGVPDVKQRIQPCVHGDAATIAMVVNMIPKVINAKPGLLTMKDLPVPSAAPEDMRKYVSL